LYVERELDARGREAPVASPRQAGVR
jgi:hypothetical protein